MIFALVLHSAADSMRSMLEGSHHHLSVRTRAPNNRTTIPPLYTWCLMPSGLYYSMIGKVARNDLPILETRREREKKKTYSALRTLLIERETVVTTPSKSGPRLSAALRYPFPLSSIDLDPAGPSTQYAFPLSTPPSPSMRVHRPVFVPAALVDYSVP